MNTAATESRLSGRIVFTDAAATQVAGLLAGQSGAGLYLRLFARGGGCGGFEYGFEFDDRDDANDLTIHKQGAALRIDPQSYQNLVGATIDYRQDPHGEGFVIENPNEAGSCSCGPTCGHQG
ncbi:MAG: iron-sulfur cluster assembly accessory protein [Ottowia sp.]|nr:iron-sulfur cluster assembly accessory protein [Ottowia sp.]